MFALIIIFAISFLALAFFLGYKVKMLRTGRLNMPEVIIHPIHHIKAELYDMERHFVRAMKESVRYMIFTTGKLWIVTAHSTRRYLKSKFPKLFKLKFRENGKGKQITLFFSRTMAEYRVRMKRFKHRLIEEDKKDEE